MLPFECPAVCAAWAGASRFRSVFVPLYLNPLHTGAQTLLHSRSCPCLSHTGFPSNERFRIIPLQDRSPAACQQTGRTRLFFTKSSHDSTDVPPISQLPIRAAVTTTNPSLSITLQTSTITGKFHLPRLCWTCWAHPFPDATSALHIGFLSSFRATCENALREFHLSRVWGFSVPRFKVRLAATRWLRKVGNIKRAERVSTRHGG